MSIISSHDNLPDVFMRELRQIQDYNPAERVDSAQARSLDIFFAYRLLLGRYPEFDDPVLYRARANGQDLYTLVMSFLGSAEFQVRMPRPLEFDQVVMSEMPDGLRLFYNLRDRQAMRIVTGIHELDIQKAMRLILRPGMNCIDAGAHIGLYALLMASVIGRSGGKVYAFEPFPSTYNLLTKNIKENRYDGVILPYPKACHYESGHGRIFAPISDDLGPVFVPRHYDAQVTAGLEGMGIELTRVDDLIPPQSKVGLIKMDIEGSEPFALRGMTRIVTHDRPVIFTEFNPYCLRHMNESDPAQYLTQLRTYGYKLFEVLDFLQQSKQEYDYRGGDVTTNLVCIPSELSIGQVLV